MRKQRDDTTATISSTSPRAEVWRRIFGGDEVPVLGPVPVNIALEGQAEQPCLLLDLRALEPEQTDRLVAYLAERFEEDPDAVRTKLAEVPALPITAEDVSVMSTKPWFL